jgi:hypothetical protein
LNSFEYLDMKTAPYFVGHVSNFWGAVQNAGFFVGLDLIFFVA